MTASIEVSPEYNLVKIATIAGNSRIEDRLYKDGCLYVEGVTQEALDNALKSYEDNFDQEKIEKLKQFLSKYRFEMEIGGIDVSGVKIQTDRETRATLVGARINAKENTDYFVYWKSSNGFIKLTSEQIIIIADLVSSHVQKCYEAEKVTEEDISSSDTEENVKQKFDMNYRA